MASIEIGGILDQNFHRLITPAFEILEQIRIRVGKRKNEQHGIDAESHDKIRVHNRATNQKHYDFRPPR